MTHDQIEEREIVEAYVRDRLTEEDRKAFEDHFFSCEECFASVKTHQRFADGVRYAAEAGLLPGPQRVSGGIAGWFRPAFLFSAAAAVIMTLITGWLTLMELPRMRLDAQLERDRAEQKQRREERRETQMAMVRPPESQANLPLVMLEASRSDGSNLLIVPPAASQAAIWMEADPGATAKIYRLEIGTVAGRPVETVDGLMKNGYGALAASVPASKLAPGKYRVRLSSVDGTKTSLVAEYRLEVRR